MLNIKNKFFTQNYSNILSYLISIVPAALIAGPFVADLLVTFCAIIFSYLIYRDKLFFFYKIWIVKILFFFWLYLIFKSLILNEELHSILRSLFYIRYILFSLLVCYVYNLNKNFSKVFFKILTVTLLVLAIHAYFIHFFGFDLLKINFENFSLKQNFSIIFTEWDVPVDYRISGLFYSESIMGSYVEKILPIYLGLIYLLKKSKKYFILTTIFFLLIFISGERASIALSILFLVTFFLCSKSNLKEKIFMFSVLFLVIIFVYTNPNLKHRIIDNTIFNVTEKKVSNELSVHEKKNNINLNLFSIGHQGHFTSAYKIFLDNPIFGVGIKNFRYECQKPQYKDIYSCTTHPHNTYMQLLAETGIIGFLFIFTIFIFLSYRIFTIIFFGKTKIKFGNHYKCFLLGVFINFWPLIPTGSFFNNWISICYFLSLGFFLGEIYKTNSQNKI